MKKDLKEKLISLKTAKLAKEKKFSENLSYDYYIEGQGKLMTDKHYLNFLYEEDKNNLIPAPRQSLLQKWLREEYKIIVLVETNSDRPNLMWVCAVQSTPSSSKLWIGHNYDSYERALEEGLQQGLKLIK